MTTAVSPPAVPGLMNRIALTSCDDARHVLRIRDGDRLVTLPLAEVDRRARSVAHRLRALGVRAGDRVGVIASNRLEWVLLDLATLKLGGVTAGFDQGRYDPARVVDSYGLRVVFAEDAPAGEGVVDIEAVRAWSHDDVTPDALHAGYDGADVCAVKFTSGSTGPPKGLEVTVASIEDSLTSVQEMFGHGDGDDILVFTRLSVLQQRYWLYSALLNGHDVTVADTESVLSVAQATHPTVVMGVPAFYEGLRARIEEDAAAAGPRERGEAIQRMLGGRVRYLWTGSAPASRPVLDFFTTAGVPIFEGYGLNETCIVAKNHPGAWRLGSVGRVLPNKRIRFDADGVLIVGSRNGVNSRYAWCTPGDSERMFLPTGEVRTFDLGHVDEDGFLYIHGRVDDVLTLSNGRNILVRPIEESIREHREVHDCVLVGAGRPCLAVVVSPARRGGDRERIAQFVAGLNDTLYPEQRVHAVVVAAEPFSIANGLLSAQLKPRRGEIAARYAAELEAFYEKGAARGGVVAVAAGTRPAGASP